LHQADSNLSELGKGRLRPNEALGLKGILQEKTPDFSPEISVSLVSPNRYSILIRASLGFNLPLRFTYVQQYAKCLM